MSGIWVIKIFKDEMVESPVQSSDGSVGRAAASYPADQGSNPAVSGSYEIIFSL